MNSSMVVSPSGIALIKEEEGFRSSVYDDTRGLATIGYGHKLKPGESFPKGISQAQALSLLANDSAIAGAKVNDLVKVLLTQNQFDALVDFTYNLGGGALASSTLLKKLNAGDYQGAAAEILKWDHAGHVELDGLKKRRQREHQLFLS